ncbi:hypothetical protein ACROYT_G008189 [Oculina patagonica]
MTFLLLDVLLLFIILGQVSGEEDTTCETRTENGKCCVFPFIYQGQETHFCTRGGPSRFDWCATTNNYDRDGDWGICTGVKCYICSSGVSWSDCESHQKAHNCPYMYDQCLTLSKEEGFTNTSKLFHKKCTSNRLCTAYNPTCEGPDVIKCDFSCCMGDYCNTASRYSKLGIVSVVFAGWVSYMFD